MVTQKLVRHDLALPVSSRECREPVAYDYQNRQGVQSYAFQWVEYSRVRFNDHIERQSPG
jgi:hypothetical protein